MKIEAKVILDSEGMYSKIRITTIELTFPTFILPQVLTHRVFSRNTSSLRAMPTKKVLEMVENSTSPICWWGKHQKGMRAYDKLEEDKEEQAKKLWEEAKNNTIEIVKKLSDLGLAKEIVNRLLIPFSWTKMLVTSTEWKNYLYLRLHESTQEEHRVLAKSLDDALKNSVPTKRKYHIPYVSTDSWEKENLINSVACCARISYMNHEGKNPTFEENLNLYQKLIGEPPHLSPFEHQAVDTGRFKYYYNLFGWKSYRFIIENYEPLGEKISEENL